MQLVCKGNAPECPEPLVFSKIQYNKLGQWSESYVTPESPNGFAGRCSPALGCESSIKPLTSTTFDPDSLPPGCSNSKEFRGFLTALSNGRNVGQLLSTAIRIPLGLIKRHTGQHSRQHAPTLLIITPDCLQICLMQQDVPDVSASVFRQIRGRAYRRCIHG